MVHRCGMLRPGPAKPMEGTERSPLPRWKGASWRCGRWPERELGLSTQYSLGSNRVVA